MTYEKYMEIVPEKTKKLVEDTLPYLWFYVKRGRTIELKNEKPLYNDNPTALLVISLLLGASQDNEINSLFESKGFMTSEINVSKDNLKDLSFLEKKAIFEQCIEIFTPYIDITKYKTIQPIDIISSATDLIKDSYNNVLDYINCNNNLIIEIKSQQKKVHREQELKIEQELFEHLPISTINYLETASKIRTIILDGFECDKIQDQDLLINNDSYIVPMSLLLALFEFEGKEKEEIINYFYSKEINKEKIKGNIQGLTLQNLRYTERNLNCIKELYKRYWTEGINQGKQSENITVMDILNNVLDRNFTSVVNVDKLFEKLKINKKDLEDMKEKIETSLARKKIDEEINYAKNFYKDLRRDTKEFINFTAQAYQLLLKKMQKGKHNQEILNYEDDADSLALYIASHYYNTDFEKFYVEHGVTFEKVLKLLNITISKEEIEQEKLNQKIVVDRFKRFVMSGVNNNKKIENILINDVALNLCDRNFNKSMIMENIFEEIRRDINLPADFINTLKNYFEEKERIRKEKLIEEYFLNKSNEMYDYLENVSIAYQTLEKIITNRTYKDEELIPLSLLYGVFMSENETKKLYEKIGLTESRLDNYLNIKFSRNKYGEIDIDLIINKIDPYINQITEKDSTKVLSVAEVQENILNSKRKKSLPIVRLLAQYNLTYESFDDFSKIKIEIEKEKQEKEIENKAGKLLHNCTRNAEEIIKQATQIFQILEKDKNEQTNNIIVDNTVDISMLLSILNRQELDSYKYFNKYKVTSSSIINLLNLPKNIMEEATRQKYSPSILLRYFKEYQVPNGKDVNTILNTLLKKNSNIIKSLLEALGVDYEIFKTECLTREDYENTLTIDDRSKLLEKIPTKEVKTDNTTSIITYGSELSNHTTFINNHCSELILKEQTTEAIETIQKILDQVYEKKNVPTKQLNWFEKMMGIKEETTEEIKVNNRIISELKNIVSKYILPLYEDIKTFDSLVKYLEIYRKKIEEHKEKICEKLIFLTQEYNKISEDDFEKKLRVQTFIKALEAKKDSFELTEQLIKQYIYKTYFVMQNDLVTITGLEMSRDALIPLLEAEIMIGNSIQNQSNGAKITENVIKLLSEVVNKNALGIQESLEEVKKSGIPEEKLSILSQDITKYLSQLNTTNDPNSITIQEIPPLTPELELKDCSKQKIYTPKNE